MQKKVNSLEIIEYNFKKKELAHVHDNKQKIENDYKNKVYKIFII